MSDLTRPAPRHGLSLTYLGLELKRAGTRIITLFFCAAMPIGFYLLFGSMQGWDETAGRGNVNAVMLIFMAFYGAAMTASTEALTIAYERPQGWNRALRLTPLRPWAYIGMKTLAALIAALASVVLLLVAALLWGRAQMPVWMWLAGIGIAMLGAVTFGAIGQTITLLLKPDVSTGLIIPIILVSCFLSGVVAIPLSGSVFEVVQKVVPLGGLVNLTLSLFGPEATLSDAGGLAPGDWRIWANIIGWIILGVVGSAWAWSRDTKRQ
ncbi:MAG: ABC transporter permease [Propionibacteriaceae bacterium]|jgi:ABC-2 type transport system permease protein|nr:ABC transporter permease [Propionibacteriaceae bacterium]